ncbi:Endoglycoceramidase, partial [Symbiodinium microadriaticum]
VLQSFQGFEGLLGVNLINEPFVGNPYTDPGLMVPEAAD